MGVKVGVTKATRNVSSLRRRGGSIYNCNKLSMSRLYFYFEGSHHSLSFSERDEKRLIISKLLCSIVALITLEILINVKHLNTTAVPRDFLCRLSTSRNPKKAKKHAREANTKRVKERKRHRPKSTFHVSGFLLSG